jgi:hypothetical protein
VAPCHALDLVEPRDKRARVGEQGFEVTIETSSSEVNLVLGAHTTMLKETILRDTVLILILQYLDTFGHSKIRWIKIRNRFEGAGGPLPESTELDETLVSCEGSNQCH